MQLISKFKRNARISFSGAVACFILSLILFTDGLCSKADLEHDIRVLMIVGIFLSSLMIGFSAYMIGRNHE